jgi:hypothetical protein
MRVGEPTGKGMSVKIYAVCKTCPEHEPIPFDEDHRLPPCPCRICERDRVKVVDPWF